MLILPRGSVDVVSWQDDDSNRNHQTETTRTPALHWRLLPGTVCCPYNAEHHLQANI